MTHSITGWTDRGRHFPALVALPSGPVEPRTERKAVLRDGSFHFAELTRGKYVLPGLIDCHVHVGPDYDDWGTATRMAARTGLTVLSSRGWSAGRRPGPVPRCTRRS